MKNLFLAGFIILLLSGVSCRAQTEKSSDVSSVFGSDVEIFYFHMTARCVTCKTVEAEARKDIETLYPDQLKAGEISFISLNLEEAKGKAVSDKLGVSGQTLLIVKGDKRINITNEGFLYAVSKPDKFREIIKVKVDPLLK